MATIPPALASKADAQIATAWAAVRAMQAQVPAKQRYAQIGRTHSTTPKDGTDAACDLKAAKVADRGALSPTWADLGQDTLAVELRLDEYEGPQGKGYSLAAKVRAGNSPVNVFERVVHEGPESWREQAWRQVS